MLQTELLESRAMFSATEMPQVDDSPIDDSCLDIPACERPYGQDNSGQSNSGQGNSQKPFREKVVCWFKDLGEGKKRLDSDTNDLCLGINEPEPEPAEERGECYKELDDGDEEKKKNK